MSMHKRALKQAVYVQLCMLTNHSCRLTEINTAVWA